MNAIELGKFLATLRNEKKLTQEDLAEKLFIDKRKISRWECGMSIPDFDMLIKLSEILDVSLYELSICQRLKKEKLKNKAIQKFKNIKDFKNYQTKRKIITILGILLGIFFIFSTIYTLKFYGTVEIYEFNSLDEKYDLKGTYIQANNYAIYNINRISSRINNIITPAKIEDCEFEIYNDDTRVLSFINEKNNLTNNYNNNYSTIFYYGKLSPDYIKKDKLQFKIICKDKQILKENETINFELIKKYDNRLF